MAKRKLDLLFWGYVANVINSMLKPYREGKEIKLSSEDKEIIKQSERFLGSILKGCDIISSPNRLSFSNSHEEVPYVTALNLAIEIFSSMAVLVPNDLGEFKKKLNNYQEVMTALRTSQDMSGHDPDIVDEVISFFGVLGNKADQVSYEETFSS